ncbi:TrkA C-terminal domain-containing protein [Pyruvatibacter sp.]|uniref:cation:proton antiporter regulatory subunit n=1 Tax=Pyruvatibacter sp. TaxID=1981328 RepID=UPI0032ED1905
MDFIADRVAFPEVDVRQRLTVSKGYGVAEIHIHESNWFVGRTLAESGLFERDIAVLTLNRGAKVISNPKGSRELEANDRLLCYGRLEAMRDLVPVKRRRRRRKVRRLADAAATGMEAGG